MSEFLRNNINNVKIIVAILIMWILFHGKNRISKLLKALIIVLGIFGILEYFKQGFTFITFHLF